MLVQVKMLLDLCRSGERTPFCTGYILALEYLPWIVNGQRYRERHNSL